MLHLIQSNRDWSPALLPYHYLRIAAVSRVSGNSTKEAARRIVHPADFLESISFSESVCFLVHK